MTMVVYIPAVMGITVTITKTITVAITRIMAHIGITK